MQIAVADIKDERVWNDNEVAHYCRDVEKQVLALGLSKVGSEANQHSALEQYLKDCRWHPHNVLNVDKFLLIFKHLDESEKGNSRQEN